MKLALVLPPVVLDHRGRSLAVLALLAFIPGLGVLRPCAGPLGSPAGPASGLAEQDRALFHDVDEVVLLLRPPPATRLDTPEGLELIKRLHDSLLPLPGVERVRLRSLASLIDPPPWTPFYDLAPLLDDIPHHPKAFAHLLAHLRGSTLCRGLYLCRDGDAAAIYIRMAGDRDHRDRALVERIEKCVRDTVPTSYRAGLAGPVARDVFLARRVRGGIELAAVLMVVVVGLVPLLPFERAAAAAMVLARSGIVMLWTLGAMGICAAPASVGAAVAPRLLIALAWTLTGVTAMLLLFASHGRSDRSVRTWLPIGAAAGLVFCLFFLTSSAGIGGFASHPWFTGGEAESAEATEAALRAHLWGIEPIDVVLTAPRPLFFHGPKGARLLEEVSGIVERSPEVRGILNPLLAFQIAARTLGYEDVPVSGLPPETLTVLSEQLQLASRRIDFDQVLTHDGRSARIRVFLNDGAQAAAAELAERWERELPSVTAAHAVSFHVGGRGLAASSARADGRASVARPPALSLVGAFTLLLLVLHRPASMLRAREAAKAESPPGVEVGS